LRQEFYPIYGCVLNVDLIVLNDVLNVDFFYHTSGENFDFIQKLNFDQ
jgi:hypothetical protein